jgi:hypothetical protein
MQQRILTAGSIGVLLALQAAALPQTSFSSRAASPRHRPLPSRFASRVVAFTQGSGPGIFQIENALDGPRGAGPGAGSTDVLSLGRGGSLTLGFETELVDGPGADFTVFENGLVSSGGVFSETAFIEVSSDGLNFARFPSTYAGAPGPLPPFGTVAFGTYEGLAGDMPVLANVETNAVDPFDPVVSGGTAFDLADLSDHPLAISGLLDLERVELVRLVDVRSGMDSDSQGTLIWDNGEPGSADIDALALIQHRMNQTIDAPLVDFFMDDLGHLHLLVHDAQGLASLESRSPSASINASSVSFATVRSNYLSTTLLEDSHTLHLRTPLPVSGSGMTGVLAVSARDGEGHFSADQASLQGF